MMGDLPLIGLPLVIAAGFLALAIPAGLGARALGRRTDPRGRTGAWITCGSALALGGLFAFMAVFHAVTG
jgi:hypothetical protein